MLLFNLLCLFGAIFLIELADLNYSAAAGVAAASSCNSRKNSTIRSSTEWVVHILILFFI